MDSEVRVCSSIRWSENSIYVWQDDDDARVGKSATVSTQTVLLDGSLPMLV